MKYFGNIDLQGNYISNVAIENKSTANITSDSINTGRVQYDTTKDALIVDRNNTREYIHTGNSFANVQVVRTSSGNVTLTPNDLKDTFGLEEGDNMKFEVDELNNRVKLSANVFYTANNFSTPFGDSANTVYTINHNLGTPNVVATVMINQGASVHPDLTVKQFEVIDDDNVKITLNVDPDGENLTAVINSRHGNKGPQGPQGDTGNIGATGATGPQGPAMSDILQYSGDAIGNTLITTTNGNVITSNVISFTDNGSDRSINVNTSSNVGVVYTNTHDYSTTIGKSISMDAVVTSNIHKSNVRYLTIYNQLNSSPKIELFNIDGYGRIYTNYLSNTISANSIVKITPSGYLESTDMETDNAILIKRKKVTISSAQIKNSYTSPVELIEAPGSGKIISPIDITVKYTYSTTPYNWTNSAVIQLATATNRFLDIDAAILNGTRTAYQKTPITFIENVGLRYFTENSALIFKTLNQNPTSGAGSLTIEIKYTIIDF